MDAYPGDSEPTLKAEMRRQVRTGANVVWLGHNNPGEVGDGKNEPGLSYAVWAAYPRRNNANDTPRPIGYGAGGSSGHWTRHASLGVRVVLPVGYQIQMGAAWNLAHPTGSAPGCRWRPVRPRQQQHQRLLLRAPATARHRQPTTVGSRRPSCAPMPRTILMLNLADEPAGRRLLHWADRVFRAAHGYGLRQAGTDPARQEAVGRFESEYIANYAAWSARQWLAIDPAITVTHLLRRRLFALHARGAEPGGHLPLAAANFVVTFDAYPRDGLYNTPLRERDLIALFSLVRTLGYYSALYHRPLWLWSAANSWGLNEASTDPGNIADAVANGIYLAQLARQTGGDLQGIAVWNYNIQGQGLYNDTHHTAYSPDADVRARLGQLPAVTRANGRCRPAGPIRWSWRPTRRSARGRRHWRCARPTRTTGTRWRRRPAPTSTPSH